MNDIEQAEGVNIDVIAQGGEYDNALQAASFGGHDKVVRMLLEKGADVNVQGGEYSNADAAREGSRCQYLRGRVRQRTRYSKVMTRWCRCCSTTDLSDIIINNENKHEIIN